MLFKKVNTVVLSSSVKKAMPENLTFLCSKFGLHTKYYQAKEYSRLKITVNVWNPKVQMSDIAKIQTKARSDFSTFGFWTFGIFGTHTKRSDFSMFGFQTVSKIRTFECVRSNMYHWLLNGLQHAFFWFCFDTPTFSLTE